MLGTEPQFRPRLADVAAHAGVSAATASRVLTGSARVRPETRQQVEAAIASLGYVRNRAPRASASRTGSIAFLVCEDNARVFSDPFFPSILRSVSRELSARSIQLVLLTAHSTQEYQTASRYLRGGHVDGALVVSMHGKGTLDPRSLGVPVVVVGRPVDGAEGISYVDADNAGGAQLAVEPAEERPDHGGHDRRAAGHDRGRQPAGRLPEGHVGRWPARSRPGRVR